MNITAGFANSLLKLIFQNTAIANIGDASGLQPSGTTGNLYISLHNADPIGGNQTTSETAYTSYTRKDVARTSGGFTVSGQNLSNAATIAFPQCTGGTDTISHFGIGTASSGAGVLLYAAPLVASWLDFTAKASTDVFTIPGNTLVVNDPIIFSTLPGETLPSGISQGTIYYVKTVSTNDITISTTPGGSTLDITTDGSGAIGKIATLSVSSGITPQFSAGGLTGIVG